MHPCLLSFPIAFHRWRSCYISGLRSSWIGDSRLCAPCVSRFRTHRNYPPAVYHVTQWRCW
jgi:hypothetical protein